MNSILQMWWKASQGPDVRFHPQMDAFGLGCKCRQNYLAMMGSECDPAACKRMRWMRSGLGKILRKYTNFGLIVNTGGKGQQNASSLEQIEASRFGTISYVCLELEPSSLVWLGITFRNPFRNGSFSGFWFGIRDLSNFKSGLAPCFGLEEFLGFLSARRRSLRWILYWFQSRCLDLDSSSLFPSLFPVRSE